MYPIYPERVTLYVGIEFKIPFGVYLLPPKWVLSQMLDEISEILDGGVCEYRIIETKHGAILVWNAPAPHRQAIMNLIRDGPRWISQHVRAIEQKEALRIFETG